RELPISHESVYEEKLQQNREKGYRLFKHTLQLLPVFLKGKMGKPAQTLSIEHKPAQPPLLSLLYVLQQEQQRLPDVPILIFELSESGWEDGAVEELEQLLQQGAFKDQLPNLQVIYPLKSLSADDYYLLDQHLKPAGHQKIADALVPLITATLSSQ
ncbi:MAG: hypothetical protein AAFV80_13025, partial [Bacteroidota bacterium]